MRTCIITGASSGIGRATAIALSKSGEYDQLVLIARRSEELEITMQKMEVTCCTALPIAFDLSDLQGIPDLVKTLADQCSGSIEGLINVSGYTQPAALLDTTIVNMEMTYRVNVFSVFSMIKECTKYMKANGGKILNVASTAGSTPRSGWLAYASSKAAVISMSKTLSTELAEYGILVYCVSPGRCATPLRRILAPDEDQSKIMQPEMVADIICNLMCQKERCLDGQDIIIRKQS